MSDNTTLTIRTKKQLKDNAKNYFDSLGISVSAAVNMFLNDVVSNQALSFSIQSAPFGTLYQIPKEELSVKAMEELKRVEELKEDDFHSLTADDYDS